MSFQTRTPVLFAIAAIFFATIGSGARASDSKSENSRPCAEALENHEIESQKIEAMLKAQKPFVVDPLSNVWGKLRNFFMGESPAAPNLGLTGFVQSERVHEISAPKAIEHPPFVSQYTPLSEASTAATAPSPHFNSESSKRVSARMAHSALNLATHRYSSSAEIIATLNNLEKALLSNTFQQDATTRDNLLRKVRGIQIEMAAIQVQYENLTLLGTDIISERDKQYTRTKHLLRYLESLFSLIEEAKGLSPEELEIQEQVLALLNQIGSPSADTESERIGQALLRQVTGPVSKDYLELTFPSKSPGQRFHWKSMADALKAGNLDRLLMLNQLSEFMRFLLFETYESTEVRSLQKYRVPQNDHDFDLTVAKSFDEWEQFHRDGMPSRLDFLRLLGGDLMARAYYDKVRSRTETRETPLVITHFLVDNSGSMTEKNKDIFRNALVMRFLDHAEFEERMGIARHRILFSHFTSQINKTVDCLDQNQKLALFKSLEKMEIVSDGGTQITTAMLQGLDYVIKAQKDDSEISHTNTVLITDGEDNVDSDAILKKVGELSPHIQTAINVLNLGNKNPSLETFATRVESDPRLQSISKPYQHLPFDLIASLTNLEEIRKRILGIAKDEIVTPTPQLPILAGSPPTSQPSTPTTTLSPGQIELAQLIKLKESLGRLLYRRENFLQEGRATLNSLRLMLHSLEPGVQDPDLEKYIDEMSAIEKTALFQTYVIEERAHFIMDFLSAIAKEYDYSVETIVQRMTPSLRQKFRDLLEKGKST